MNRQPILVRALAVAVAVATATTAVTSVAHGADSEGAARSEVAAEKPPAQAAYVEELANRWETSRDAAARRLAVEPHGRLLADRANAAFPERFAGSWYEDDGSMVLHLMMVGGSRGVNVAALRQGLSRDLQVVVQEAAHSIPALQAAVSRVMDMPSDDVSPAYQAYGAGTKARANQIYVYYGGGDPNFEEAARAAAAPISVQFEYGPPERPLSCTSQSSCLDTPGRGALKVQNTDGPYGPCTSAFVAVVGGYAGVLTAKHCFPNNTDVFHGTTKMGRVTAIGPLHGDYEFVKFAEPWRTTAVGGVFRRSYNNGIEPVWAIERVSTSTEYPENEVTKHCQMGWKVVYERCGSVIDNSHSYTFGGEEFRDLYRVAACSIEGDSGAPVYTLGRTAAGVLSGGNNYNTSACTTGTYYSATYISKVVAGLKANTGLSVYLKTMPA